MKAYIIEISLIDSNPLIWRKVILPADATFKRLHDVIQTVTNFQSGYPGGGYHLYEFDLSEENKLVTDNEEAYEEHQYYKKNKSFFENRLKTIKPELIDFEQHYQERLQKEVRKPSGLKIDTYLEKYQSLIYTYDFGDDWKFLIELESVVEDYYFGYPTLLDGAETAPPEDVGGLFGYEEFIEIYRNPKHPEHEEMKIWAESQFFREYDYNWINENLKSIRYKKTEWDEITHKNYSIIEDKYRKSNG